MVSHIPFILKGRQWIFKNMIRISIFLSVGIYYKTSLVFWAGSPVRESCHFSVNGVRERLVKMFWYQKVKLSSQPWPSRLLVEEFSFRRGCQRSNISMTLSINNANVDFWRWYRSLCSCMWLQVKLCSMYMYCLLFDNCYRKF